MIWVHLSDGSRRELRVAREDVEDLEGLSQDEVLRLLDQRIKSAAEEWGRADGYGPGKNRDRTHDLNDLYYKIREGNTISRIS